MGLEKYIKLTSAAKLCGLDKRTLLARLKEAGLEAPPQKHRRPILVRELDVEEVMRNCSIQPRDVGRAPGDIAQMNAYKIARTED